jgi:3-methyladenine DNA glycosylase/8-oxoguanine DNA glycosylase
MELILEARSPFNFRSVVKSHGWYLLAPFEWDETRGSLSRVEQPSSGRVVLLVMSGDTHQVRVRCADRLRKREQQEVAERVRWMFMLDTDFDEFYQLADDEPRLAHCRAQAHGRLLRSGSLWEDVVKVMLTTNIQWSGTKRLASALVKRFGDPLPGHASRRAFPQPERIARSRESVLRKLGLGYRSPYLLQLARGVVSGRYALEALNDPTRTTDEVRRLLLALPGFGPYAAATLLGLLGRYDYIGVDTEALSAVSKAFYGGKPIGTREIEAVFARWGKFKSLAYWFWDWDGQQQAPMDAYAAKAKP